MIFEMQKPNRIHNRYFFGVMVPGYWWYPDQHQWIPDTNDIFGGKWDCSTHAPCRSLRAFKRMLRKHPHIKGKAILCSRAEGYDILG